MFLKQYGFGLIHAKLSLSMTIFSHTRANTLEAKLERTITLSAFFPV